MCSASTLAPFRLCSIAGCRGVTRSGRCETHGGAWPRAEIPRLLGRVNPTRRQQVIAELSSNHGGDWRWILRAIDQCAHAGVDCLKGQSFQAKFLRPGDPQKEWLTQAELSLHDLAQFFDACHAAGVIPMMSVFDCERPQQLRDIGYTHVKIGAGDAMRSDLMAAVVGAKFPHVYVSLGLMGSPPPCISLPAGTVLMHCVTQYPASFDSVQMGIPLKWPVPSWGYSDHTIGLDACKLAIALGAVVVEKHVCLENGRANSWDALPAGFAELVTWRDTVETLKGDGDMLRAPNPEAVTRFVGRWRDHG